MSRWIPWSSTGGEIRASAVATLETREVEKKDLQEDAVPSPPGGLARPTHLEVGDRFSIHPVLPPARVSLPPLGLQPEYETVPLPCHLAAETAVAQEATPGICDGLAGLGRGTTDGPGLLTGRGDAGLERPRVKPGTRRLCVGTRGWAGDPRAEGSIPNSWPAARAVQDTGRRWQGGSQEIPCSVQSWQQMQQVQGSAPRPAKKVGGCCVA